MSSSNQHEDASKAPRVLFNAFIEFRCIYNKLLLGGTFEMNVCETLSCGQFLCDISRILDTFILDLYFVNRTSGSFILEIERMKFSHAMLSVPKKPIFQFTNKNQNCYNFVKTFTFTMDEIQRLANDDILFIKVKISSGIIEELDFDVVCTVVLEHGFANLLKDPVDWDFIIESADNYKFKVHKMILGSQSPVFDAMFKDGMIAPEKKFVKLKDVDKEDVESLLEYMYTGNIRNIMKKDCMMMLMLAEKFDLPGLDLLSEHALANKLTLENVIELFSTGTVFDRILIGQVSLGLIVNDKILTSEAWQRLDNSQTSKAIFEILLSTKYSVEQLGERLSRCVLM